jgi:hypothetical protein
MLNFIFYSCNLFILGPVLSWCVQFKLGLHVLKRIWWSWLPRFWVSNDLFLVYMFFIHCYYLIYIGDRHGRVVVVFTTNETGHHHITAIIYIYIHAELDFYSASSLKQQSTVRHVAPLGHIILIPSQPVFALPP